MGGRRPPVFALRATTRQKILGAPKLQQRRPGAVKPRPPPRARPAAGDLQRPEVLAAQARRMLQDDRAMNFAKEFGGHWLDFRRFEEHNAVDRERFPAFDSDLRQAMFEEPIRFIVDLVREDRSVLNFLY